MRIGPLGVPELLLLAAVLVVPTILLWRVFSRAGFPGALSLLMLFPPIGWLIALCILAFVKWPMADPTAEEP